MTLALCVLACDLLRPMKGITWHRLHGNHCPQRVLRVGLQPSKHVLLRRIHHEISNRFMQQDKQMTTISRLPMTMNNYVAIGSKPMVTRQTLKSCTGKLRQ